MFNAALRHILTASWSPIPSRFLAESEPESDDDIDNDCDDEVFDDVGDKPTVEVVHRQTKGMGMSIPLPSSGRDHLRSQCFCEKIGRSKKALYRYSLILALCILLVSDEIFFFFLFLFYFFIFLFFFFFCLFFGYDRPVHLDASH